MARKPKTENLLNAQEPALENFSLSIFLNNLALLHKDHSIGNFVEKPISYVRQTVVILILPV
jgi:hypothetical protein